MVRLRVRNSDGTYRTLKNEEVLRVERKRRHHRKYGYLYAQVNIPKRAREFYGFQKKRGKRMRRMRGFRRAVMTSCAIHDRYIKPSRR